MPTPTRPGHCSLCGLSSVSDPCMLCERDHDRRIVKTRARAERERTRVQVALHVGDLA